MTEWRTVRRNGRKVRIPVTTAGNGHLNIQKSIRHPGRVREYVRREYGDEAFTERGTIKPEYLEKAKERAEAQHNRSLVDAVDLAMRLNALRQHNVQSQ